MNEFPENIKFFEENGQHGYKRINAEGGTEFTSPLFDSRERAEEDARTNVNGVHAVEASDPGAEPSVAEGEEAPSNEIESAPETQPEPEAGAETPAEVPGE